MANIPIHIIGMTDIDNLPSFSHILDYRLLVVMGIVLEIFGTLFISMEAIGLERFSQHINRIRKLSRWYKKSFLRMSLLIVPILAILFFGLMFGIIFNLKIFRIFIVLFIPIVFLLAVFSLLMDQPDYYEKWIIIKTENKKISSIGFLVFVFGAFLQIISLIWQ